MKHNHLFLSISACILCSCDLIDYHPYDVRISGDTDVNATNIAEIEALCQNKDTIRFITMGDSQRWYDETEDFVNLVNSRTDIDFVIHGGDISDFGVTSEFLIQRLRQWQDGPQPNGGCRRPHSLAKQCCPTHSSQSNAWRLLHRIAQAARTTAAFHFATRARTRLQ